MSLLQNKSVHGFGGLLLMGGWAMFANRAHEMPAPLIAGLVQGALTGMITLFLKQIIESIFHRTHGVARLLLPPLVAFCVSLILLIAIHSLAGTPALFTTIAIPVAVSTLYAFFYSYTLSRHV